MIGHERHRWDRTQATVFVTVIALLGSIPSILPFVIFGALS